MSNYTLIAGNWKMNGLRQEAHALANAISEAYFQIKPKNMDVLICPPATLLSELGSLIEGSGVLLGAQDCHSEEKGAHTGDISAFMLENIGCRYVIVGHSERRCDHGETNELVCEKARAAHKASLIPIICIGESEGQKNDGKTFEVLEKQIIHSVPKDFVAKDFVLAYEPIWAIGTGRTPLAKEVEETHQYIRRQLSSHLKDGAHVRLLYGGSVKPNNAKEFLSLENVNGALVGGASLKADDFWQIILAGSES